MPKPLLLKFFVYLDHVLIIVIFDFSSFSFYFSFFFSFSFSISFFFVSVSSQASVEGRMQKKLHLILHVKMGIWILPNFSWNKKDLMSSLQMRYVFFCFFFFRILFIFHIINL